MIEVGDEATLALVDRVLEALEGEHGVRRQQVIEILMANHAVRVGTRREFVIDSMAKHAKQLLVKR